MTLKAQEELRELKVKERELKERENDMRRKGFRYEANSYSQKWARVYDKISEIERYNLSTSELSGLKREVGNMTSLTSERNIGSRERTVIGYSKVLQNHVIVTYTHFSGFMRNVRGAGSLANTKSFSSIRIISKAQYDNIVGKPRIHREHGWGYSRRETERPEALGGVF